MSPAGSGDAALLVQLRAVTVQRDRAEAARLAALSEVERLRAEVVRLQAELETYQTASAADGRRLPGRTRGLASLFGVDPAHSRPA